MKVGDIIRYRQRYNGQLFMIIEMKKNALGDPIAKCMRVHDGYYTRWSNITTMEIVND